MERDKAKQVISIFVWRLEGYAGMCAFYNAMYL